MDAIFYIVKTGCQWRMLPKDFAPWQTVYYYFRKWKHEGAPKAIQKLEHKFPRLKKILADGGYQGYNNQNPEVPEMYEYNFECDRMRSVDSEVIGEYNGIYYAYDSLDLDSEQFVFLSIR